jgi:hypothetical protein
MMAFVHDQSPEIDSNDAILARLRRSAPLSQAREGKSDVRIASGSVAFQNREFIATQELDLDSL